MLTCKELTEIVTDYLEGRLSFMQRLQFHMHVGMCRHCRAYLRQMKMTVKTLGRLPHEPIPAGVRDELLERFRGARPTGGGSPAPAPAGLSRSLDVLAAIERIGSKYGWALAGLIVVGVTAALVASGLNAGAVGDGSRCLLVEIGSGVALLAAVGVLAWTKRSRLSASTWTLIAMTGSLAGFAVLQATCPMVSPHVFLFHLGGIMAAGALGLGASRLPVWR